MLYFQPRLANGQKAPIAWQIRLFFLSFCWPPKEDCSRRVRYLHRLCVAFNCILLPLSHFPQLYFLVYNADNIGLMLEGLAPYLIALEVHLRWFHLIFRNSEFKALLSEFYSKIYIHKDFNLKAYRQVERQQLPTRLYSYSFIVSVLFRSVYPLVISFSIRYVPNFKMQFPYDITPLYLYIPTLFLSIWTSLSGGCVIVGESNLLITSILHLNARYTLLQSDVYNLHSTLKRTQRRNRVLSEFRHRLVDIVRRNVALNEFAGRLRAAYSFRIFVLLGLSAIMLCVLGFTVATRNLYGTSSSVVLTYLVWITAKIVELLVLGHWGSQLIEKTNEMSSMYYQSNWEDVILESSDSTENARLMKLIALCIELNQEHQYLTGLKFFNLSLETVVTILKGAGSYFTVLYAFR